MDISATRALIALGIRRHTAQVRNMGGELDALETMQVAFQILHAMHPEYGLEATDNRRFVMECGFSAETALSIISDDDPSGIY